VALKIAMEEIIKEAYSLFENYKAQSPLDICTDCCMDKKDEGLLANLPIKEIPKSLLMEYNDGATTAKTPINELKHFLPRYIELIGNFDFPSHSTEISLKRLEPFDREEWTSSELEFLEKFALTFFKNCISIHPLPENETIDSILIMFWRGQFKLTELLNSWKMDNSVFSTLHFKDLYFEGFKQKNPMKMSNAFGEIEVSKILRDWVDKREVQIKFKENIEKIIMDEIELDEYQLNQLNILYEILDKIPYNKM
jgi:hypothetical protein